MLVWIVVLAIGTALAVVARWWLRRVDALGRRRRFPWITVVGLTVIAVAAGVPVVRHARLQNRLSAVASRLAGVPVRVHCTTLGGSFTDAYGEAGYVRFGPSGTP